MGRDGAQGLQELCLSGATTIAQDKDSCVVFGMPRAAIELGAAQQIVDLSEIGCRLLDAARGPATVDAIQGAPR